MHGLQAPVLSLAPDSLASLGDLDGDSLSELWGVFTKCKDSLQNGRRLENLSWRLWFDSGRRDSRSILAAGERRASRDVTFPAENGRVRAEQEGWSDPEEWTEATDSDDDDSEVEQQPHQARAGRTSRRGSGGAAAGSRGQPDALPVSTSKTRSVSACNTTLNEARPCLSREWRSSSTISGGSIQRIITGLTSLPPLSVPIKAQSVIEAPATPLLSPGVTSRHSSAPDELERAPIAAGPPVALTTVDAPTQTTPSTSHRPSPKTSPFLSSRMALSPAGYVDAPTASTSRPIIPHATSSSSSSKVSRHSSKLSTSNGPARRQSEPRPPPSSPASYIHDASHPLNLPPAIRAQSSAHLSRIPSEVGPKHNVSFEGRSFVKGFDTTVFDSRPRQGSIAPPPTPAVALSKLAASPPKRAPSALKCSSKSSISSSGHKTAPVATGKKSGGASKKIFFISSPNSDSEDEGSSSHSRSRSASLEHHQAKRASISSSLGGRLAQPETSRAPPQGRPPSPPKKSAPEDDEWDDEDGSDDESGSSSGWGSEYSTEDETRNSRRGKSTSAPEADSPLFAKRPSLPAIENPLLKPRPPGLLSQLFHPDLFVDDSDRRHSTVDVSRRSSSGHTSRPSLLQTSKSTGVLSEQMRSKSFLKGAPAGTEMESSSDEEEGHEGGSDSDDYEDEPEPPVVDNAIATALARHQQRMRLEAAGPIAPPQTPRTTRRAMLATELSESLRRNLLWERQTRNRVMGGPVNRFAQAHAQGTAPNAQPRQAPAQTAPPAVAAEAPARPRSGPLTSPHLDGGLRAPHPSPATREPSPADRADMGPRRHTTGTGLYLAAQRDKFPGEHRDARRKRRGSHSHVARDDSDTDSTSDSSSSESESESEVLSEGQRQVRERRKSDARAAKVFGDVWGQRVW